jgi:hypothetical protein
MFAQADDTTAITHYLTTDQKRAIVYRLAQGAAPTRFRILSLRTSPRLAFGELNLNDRNDIDRKQPPRNRGPAHGLSHGRRDSETAAPWF